MISDASILNGKKAMLMMWKSWIIRDCTPDHLAEHRTPHPGERGVSVQKPLLCHKRIMLMEKRPTMKMEKA